MSNEQPGECIFLTVREACEFVAWFHEVAGVTDWDRTRLAAAKQMIGGVGVTATVEVYSRPECPFHYCDVDYTNGKHVCKDNNRCHHRPNPFEAD